MPKVYQPSLNSFRIYADTSVFGGFFEQKFCFASRAFFEKVQNGGLKLVTSELVSRELSEAPSQVQKLFDTYLPLAEVVSISPEMLKLRDDYLRARIVTSKSLSDALHVAIASISGCFIIVSWNFKQIVHFQKIGLFNAVNIANGWKPLLIHSPLEVIDYGTTDE